MAVSSAFIKTWIMPLAAGVPTWDSTTWVVENRLIPTRSNVTPFSMGSATFRLNRRTRSDDNSGAVTSSWQPVRGQYIAITTQACTVPGAAGTLWVGFIDSAGTQPLKNTDDEVGAVYARELGGILDQVPLANPRIFDLTGGVAAGIALLTIPTANAEGYTQGEVIGNAVAAPAGVQPGGYTRYQWAGQASDCGVASGNYWSRWALVDHFAKWIYSPLLPTLALSAPAAVQTLLTTVAKEVFKLQGLKFKGLLDLIAGPSRGLTWWVSVSGNTWTINFASAIDVNVGDIPAATLTTVNLSTTDIDIRLANAGFDVYDAVEVNGNAIVCCGTVSPIDATAASGWGATSQAAHLAGASGAAGYGALTTDQQLARNRQVRKSGLLADVFTRFLVAQDTTYQFQCKNVAGVPVAGSVQFFCPLVTWIAGVAAVDDTHNQAPYPPEARLLRSLPWPEGVKGDGTDQRPAEATMRPKYLPPVVLSYQVPGALTWSDLCSPPFKYWHKPTISVDPRGPALRVEFEFQEMLAFADWGGAAISECDPTLTTNYGASDWRYLVMTVAMPSDQRVRVAGYRTGVTSTTYRNPMRIERPDINCWLVRKHTIVGLKTDGTPDEVTTDTFVRNDFAVAQKLCDEASAFAFRPRTSAVITVTAPYSPPAWAAMGVTIGVVNEQLGGVTQATRTLHTIVTNIEQVWDERRPRLIVTTGDSPLPESTAIVPLVPAFGGQVSTALGMTLPSTVQRLDTELKDVQKTQERAPILTGRLPSGGISYARVRWNFGTSQADLCEGQLVSSSGVNLSPTALVWIDGYTSLRRVAPDLYGDVFYTVESAGSSVTRGAVTRPLYRVVQHAGLGTGTVFRIFQVEVTATASDVTAKVLDSSATTATTSINGSSLDNIIPLVGPGDYSLAAANRFDVQMPVRFHSVATIPGLVPDILQTSRMRSGRKQGNGSSSTITVSGLSIDPGEVFRIRVYAGDRSSSGSTAEGSITVLDEYARGLDATNFYWYLASGAGGLEISGTSAGLGGGVQSTTASATTATDSVYHYVSGATFTAVTLTITPTVDGNGRVTAVAISGLSAGPTTAVVVEGGRPQFQTSGSL